MTTPPQSERDVLDETLRTIAFWLPVVCYEHDDKRYVDIDDLFAIKRLAADARAALAIEPAPEPRQEIQPEAKQALDDIAAILHGWPDDGTRRTYVPSWLAQKLRDRLAAPPPAVLAAADALAEVVQECVDDLEWCQGQCGKACCEQFKVVKALSAYRAARSNGEGKAE